LRSTKPDAAPDTVTNAEPNAAPNAAPNTAPNTESNSINTAPNTAPSTDGNAEPNAEPNAEHNIEPNAKHNNTAVDGDCQLNPIASHAATWRHHNININTSIDHVRVDSPDQRHDNPVDARRQRDRRHDCDRAVLKRRCTDRRHCRRMRRVAVDHCSRAGTRLSRTSPQESERTDGDDVGCI
jgi:hypothetical protein